jgi:hypothetical protein
MKEIKLANLANKEFREPDILIKNPKTIESRLKDAIMILVEELKIKNGSFKIFVHNGRPGERVEIQNKVLTDI